MRRITPADAGKTFEPVGISEQFENHPRGCGENLAMYGVQPGEVGSPPRMRGKRHEKTMIAVYMGSPPRMRGKQIQRLIADTPTGITPADAGKTYKKGDIVIGFEDHPRGCGENPRRTQIQGDIKGSPPRMRGKHRPLKDALQNFRITPADAGKTKPNEYIVAVFVDHPRGCGENYCTG